MKNALILAGGKGLRLGQNLEELPKPMIPVNNKPILEYIVEMLKNTGFSRVYIVVAYKKDAIINHFKDGKKFGLNISYLENPLINDRKKSGLSDAVLLVKDIMKEPFLTILGDEIYAGSGHDGMVKTFESDAGIEAMFAVYESPDINDVKKNYTVKVDREWKVLDMEEKPQAPWNNLVGCGTYIFRPSIFELIEKTEYSAKTGRKELADTMKLIIRGKKIIKAFSIGGKYININYLEDYNNAVKLLK